MIIYLFGRFISTVNLQEDHYKAKYKPLSSDPPFGKCTASFTIVYQIKKYVRNIIKSTCTCITNVVRPRAASYFVVRSLMS